MTGAEAAPVRDPVRAPRRLSPLTPVVRAPIVMIAVLGASWQQVIAERELGKAGLILLAVLLAGGVYGAASWLRTKYWIDGAELRIDTGVVARQSRRIRIDRLQGVDIVQPLVARLFGLAELRLDVAGNDREGRLAFLPRVEAEELRQVLLVRRSQLVDPSTHARSDQRPGVPERFLARLDLGRLLVSLALSTETLSLAATGVVLLVTSALTGTLALVGGVVPALIGLAVALGRRLTAYYGFSLTESPAGLQVRRGLTALSSQTVALHRIQGVVVREPLLWRALGWAKLDVSIAGSLRADQGGASASSTLMPVAPRGEVLALAAHVLAGRAPSEVPLLRPPPRSRWVAPLSAWTSASGQDDRLTVSRHGFWVRRTDVVPFERSQSVRVTQGPLQRRLDLADVHIDSPPGPVRLVAHDRDAAQARDFARRAVVLGRSARRAAAVTEATHTRGADSGPPT